MMQNNFSNSLHKFLQIFFHLSKHKNKIKIHVILFQNQIKNLYNSPPLKIPYNIYTKVI